MDQLEPLHRELQRANRLTRVVVIESAVIAILTALVLVLGVLALVGR
jgi:hypothetical protein